MLWSALASGCAPGGGGGDPADAEAADAVEVEAVDAGGEVTDGPLGDADVEAPDAAVDAAVDPGPPGPGEAPRFAFPVHPDDRRMIHPGLFFGVDHDPADGDSIECLTYDGRGFPFCYDGHEGSDFVLDGGFVAMDAGSARVVAAAGGEVVQAVDGNYDRCSGDLQNFEPTCDGHPIHSNTVVIQHPNGWRSRYLHMMQGSVAVRVGDRVDCGDGLGRVGSSGRSYTPHLHFEVVDPTGVSVDPFSGTVSGPRSLWTLQRDADRLPGPACDPAWGPAR